MPKIKTKKVEDAILFLVEKYKALNVITKADEWEYVNDYYINDTVCDHKLHHPKLGYMDVRRDNETLRFHIDVLRVFRHATSGDDLDLIKTLFAALMDKNDNPNICYYEDTEHNLTKASKNGNLRVIEFLVENGVSIHVDGEVNVIAALKNKHYDVVQYFLETDPNIDQNIIFKNKDIDEDMIRFIENWNLYKKLNCEVINNKNDRVKIKV
jgi:hypothetical protein